jgi:hypothetical protein
MPNAIFPADVFVPFQSGAEHMFAISPIRTILSFLSSTVRLVGSALGAKGQARTAVTAPPSADGVGGAHEAARTLRDELDIAMHREALRAALPALFEARPVPPEVRAWVDAPGDEAPDTVAAWIVTEMDVIGAYDRYRSWVSGKFPGATAAELAALEQGGFRPSDVRSVEFHLKACLRKLGVSGQDAGLDPAIAAVAVNYAAAMGDEIDRRRGWRAA